MTDPFDGVFVLVGCSSPLSSLSGNENEKHCDVNDGDSPVTVVDEQGKCYEIE